MTHNSGHGSRHDSDHNSSHSSPGAAQPTLVLLNPLAMDGRCWQFLGLAHAQSFDYPGHGGRKAQAAWTFEQMADEVVAQFPGLLDLLGVSMGGALVGHILTRHPRRVRSAIIACCGDVGQVDDIETRRRAANARAEPARRDGMQAVLEANLPRWFSAFARRTGHPGIDYTRDTLLAMDAQTWVDSCIAQANSQTIAPERLRSVPQPVTIIAGLHDLAGDLAGDLASMAMLHELIPNSRMEIMPAPHMIHLERPESLAAAVDRHFTWQPIGQRVEAIIGSSGL